MLQNAPNCTIQENFLREPCPRTPLANAWPPKKLPPLGNSCIRPWTSYYKEIYLRRCARIIHSGRQLIVYSTLYVYALQIFLVGKND